MLNNYLNPNAAAPDIGWKPEGFLGGMLYRNRLQQYNDMQGLQQQMMGTSAQMENEKLQDYRMDAPVREAERGAKIPKSLLERMVSENAMQDPNYAGNVNAGVMGEAQTKAAKGKKDTATVQGDIDVHNAENVGKGLEASGRNIELQFATSPMMGQAEYQKFRSQMPEQLKTQFPEMYSPAVGEKIKQLSKVITDSPAHRREMKKQGSINQTHITTNAATNVQSGLNAQIAADSRVEAAYARLAKDPTYKKADEIVAAGFRKMWEGQPMTAQEEAVWKSAQQFVFKSRAAAAGQDPTALRSGLIGADATRAIPESEDAAIGGAQASQAEVQRDGYPYDPRYRYRKKPGGGYQRELK